MRSCGLALALLPLLTGCNRTNEDAIEPAAPASENSANQLMGLAEDAASDAAKMGERSSPTDRSGQSNEQQGDRQ